MGHERFKLILVAYETLSHPTKKSYYDIKLKYSQQSHSTSSHVKSTGQKNWNFDEKEMKRRQYYNEHIKKYAKNGDVKKTHAELKKGYNEYKYILFATPLAVALFLLIVNMATPSKKHDVIKPEETKNEIVQKTESEKTSLKMGDSPYANYFGSHFYDTLGNKTILVKNNTGRDIVVCLFAARKFLRSCFIQNGYFAEISQLPARQLDVRYMSGLEWDSSYELKNVQLIGGFTKNASFFKSVKSSDFKNKAELTILDGKNEGFTEINEKEFFTKENI